MCNTTLHLFLAGEVLHLHLTSLLFAWASLPKWEESKSELSENIFILESELSTFFMNLQPTAY